MIALHTKRSWLLAIAAINVVIGLDTDRLPPYFSDIIWRFLYFSIAILLVVFYFVRERKWFLWSCTMITATGFMRGITFFAFDQRLVPLALNLNIIILTWLFYRERWPDVPVRRKT